MSLSNDKDWANAVSRKTLVLVYELSGYIMVALNPWQQCLSGLSRTGTGLVSAPSFLILLSKLSGVETCPRNLSLMTDCRAHHVIPVRSDCRLATSKLLGPQRIVRKQDCILIVYFCDIQKMRNFRLFLVVSNKLLPKEWKLIIENYVLEVIGTGSFIFHSIQIINKNTLNLVHQYKFSVISYNY